MDAPYWAPLLDETETVEPTHYRDSNGWVVAALLGAWSAISRTDGLVPGLHAASAGGGDTDTVAAIAGQLLGATRCQRDTGPVPPSSARLAGDAGARPAPAGVPDRSRRPAGPGGVAGRRLAAVVRAGRDDGGPPTPTTLRCCSARSAPSVRASPTRSSACAALGSDAAPLTGVAPEDHVAFWTIDRDDANNDLPGQLLDAWVRDLRDEGKTVLLHCVRAHLRTPTVAAVYGAMITGSPAREALDRVVAVLPSARPRRSFVRALESMEVDARSR